MKAIVYHNYGSPEVLRYEDVEKPVPASDQVLVRVRAASVNPLDWHYVRGTPYILRMQAGLRKPKEPRLGVDFSGQIEAVGKDVTQFKPDDEVFGGRTGAFAEYVCAQVDRGIVQKPASVTFEEAASVPVAGVTALQGIRDKAKVRPGQEVLVNGAGGGVGSFAVQIAKSFGAVVTGVTSSTNVEMVKSIGADRVVDYMKEDFTEGSQRYDVIFDNSGNHSMSAYRRVMQPKGVCIMNGGGGPKAGLWVGPLTRPIKAFLYSPFVSQKFVTFLAKLKKDDLMILRGLLSEGKVKPVIDRTYGLSEVPEAISYLEGGHARGKVVITVKRDD